VQTSAQAGGREALEQAVLGALILDSSALSQLEEQLQASHFSNEIHRSTWRAIVAVHQRDKAVDLVTLTAHMERACPELLKAAGGAAYLAGLAQHSPGASNVRRYAELVRERAGEASAGDEAPPHSEDELALLFTERYGKDRKFVATWSRWLEWDSTRWRTDETLHSFDLARDVCRERAAGLARGAAAMASASTVAAVERLARADRRHAAMSEQFDADPMQLNTPAGTVDLRTGELRPHRREDWCTKRTAAGPENGEPARWLKFLDRVTGGDPALEQYLQRLFGYALTGLTSEHAFFFIHGSGANGKSTFVNTLTQILGEYAVVASAETFIETGADRHPTDLAMLRGARLVTAQEVDEGRRWALARMKALTGGDPVTARFVRADFFTYTPQFKLCISANHRPGLRTIDEAIRRRLHVVPFTVFIPPGERDQALPEALKEEYGRILSWAMEGCAEWQLHGLAQPKVIQEATAAYLTDEDVFQHWLDDACELDKRAQERVKLLYQSYHRWAERAGERLIGTKRFSQALAERGFVRMMFGDGARGFEGLRLKMDLELSGHAPG
jgi:putative DNA primase/helicase